jgi:N-methylhydantoinase A
MSVRPLTPEGTPPVIDEYTSLADQATSRIEEYGFPRLDVQVDYRADLRYVHQEHTVTVNVASEWLRRSDVLADELRDAFVTHHRQLYGHGQRDAAIELVTLRARASAQVQRPAVAEWPAMPEASPIAKRETYFSQLKEYVPTPVFDREALGRGACLDGPAIVEEWTTTILVPPGWRATVDRRGNLVMDRRQRSTR